MNNNSNLSIGVTKRNPRPVRHDEDVEDDPLTPSDPSYQRASTPTSLRSTFSDNKSSQNCSTAIYVIIAILVIAIIGVVALVASLSMENNQQPQIHVLPPEDTHGDHRVHHGYYDNEYEIHRNAEEERRKREIELERERENQANVEYEHIDQYNLHHQNQHGGHDRQEPHHQAEQQHHEPHVEVQNEETEMTLLEKREAVKGAFITAWQGYETYAFGHDELRPITNDYRDNFGGFGSTLIDSLDTMLLMGLTDEFHRCSTFVRNLDFKKDQYVSLFEFTIRHVGGLLGAFQLSHDRMFLDKARELADLLMPAFNTASGIPYTQINLATGESRNADWHKTQSILSEIGSLQVEYKYLSHHTGNPIYANKADRVLEVLESQHKSHPGLYSNYINTEEGTFAQEWFSLGALGDSFYEYLLKQYILTNDMKYWKVYRASVEGIKRNMVAKSQPNGWTYLAEYRNGQQQPKFDQLVCFVPGMLALGFKFAPQDEDRNILDDDLHLAKELMETCAHISFEQATGLAPEIASFANQTHDFSVQHPTYLLRPEIIESMFYLYKITGDVKYQQWAWALFQSIQTHCRVGSGYSGLKNVAEENPDEKHDNAMEGFFLAETLKYLYLIFGEEHEYNLNDYVFNTEAHPLRPIWK
ncbi:mannosyl-oligosaccharide alpha-1,2-mannosidase [Acrasis kona]|uniref:alpha-1,2-Mannosidase n=1 Tax=Acrasis kona TaxID=1008807 RepID=A0AAW2YSC9_9EUKA